MFVAVVVSALYVAVVATPQSINCKEETKVEGPCSIKYRVCAELHGVHLVYKTTATDAKSGREATGEGKSHDGSATAATLALFNSMTISGNATRPSNKTDPCNCATYLRAPTRRCTLLITGCAYFTSQSDLEATPPLPTWRVWAYDNDTQYFGYNDSQGTLYDHNLNQTIAMAIERLEREESLFKCLP